MSRVEPGRSEARSRAETWPGLAGHYRIVAPIGDGSVGTVFRCIDERTGQERALKLANGGGRGENAALRREYALLLQLKARHQPGVVTALESGRLEGRAWFSMEFISGNTLANILSRLWQAAEPAGPSPNATERTRSEDDNNAANHPSALESGEMLRLPHPFVAPDPARVAAGAGQLQAVLELGAKIVRTLAALHAIGVVHADLSPRNIIVLPDGSPLLVDFSSAFHTGMVESAREIAQAELGVRGTPTYMAPEQIRGLPVDGRADLYGFGCLLYELVTGRPPFSGSSQEGILRQHLHASPQKPSTRVAGVPTELDDLILSLLVKERHIRFPYALDVAKTLESLSRGSAHVADLPLPLYRARLVGRQSAVEALEIKVRGALTGEGQIVVLTGESGAGKTRLLNELAVTAQRQNMQVIVGRCQEARNSSGARMTRAAFEPLRGVLERVADQAGDALALVRSGFPDERIAAELAVLSSYEPSLAEVLATDQEISILPPHLARSRVVRAMGKALECLSRPRALLLVLDDLHFADDLTLDFVRAAVMGELNIGRTLIATSCRSDALDVQLLATLEATANARVNVERLGLDDVRTMVRDMLASSLLPEGLGEFIYRSSAGNALFAAEYLRLLANRRDLVRAEPARWSFVEPTPSVALPTSLQDLLELKLERLSPETRATLEDVSVYGAGFSFDLVLAEGNSEENRASLLSIHDLVSRELLEEHSPEHFRFVHEELRDAIERSLPAERRRTLHLNAIARLNPSQRGADIGITETLPAQIAAALGHHHARVGQHAEALIYYREAGRRAASLHGYSLAGELYRLAVVQGELAYDPSSEEARKYLIPLREDLADMLVRAARHEEARRNYDQIAASETSPALTRARALRKRGKSYWLVHDYERAHASLDAASRELGEIENLSSSEELSEWIEVSQGRFWIYYFGRKIGSASAELVRTMAPIVERAGTPAQKANFYQCAASEHMARNRYLYSEEAVILARRAVQFSDPKRYPAEAADARFALGFALVQGDRAQCEEAAQHLSEAAAAVEDIGDATIMARLLTYEAVAQRRLRRVEDVLRLSKRALSAAEAARLPAYMAAATACLAWVSWLEGNASDAERKALEAELIWQKDRHVFPFRRLSCLPLLSLRHNSEDFGGAKSLLDILLAPEQQKFPPELGEALEEARTILHAPQHDPRKSNEALARALHLAHQLAFD